MPPKRMAVDFYQVEMPQEAATTFAAVLEAVGALDLEQRNRDVRDFPVRLQTLNSQGRLYDGEMVKIRMNFVGVKAKLSGPLEAIDFERDEGLGEETAFLYNETLRVLVLQRNRMGISASALSAYFQRMAQLDAPIMLLPVLRADAMRRLEHMREV